MKARPSETQSAVDQRHAWETVAYGKFYGTLLQIRALPEVTR